MDHWYILSNITHIMISITLTVLYAFYENLELQNLLLQDNTYITIIAKEYTRARLAIDAYDLYIKVILKLKR